MNEGSLLQLDTPDEIYRHPASLFVASFIGSPPMNLVYATVHGDEVQAGEGTFHMSGAPGTDVVIGLRPEALRPTGAEDEPSLPASVELVEALGHEVIVHATMRGRNWTAISDDLVPLETDRATLVLRLPAPQSLSVGESLPLRFSLEDVHVFDAVTGQALARR